MLKHFRTIFICAALLLTACASAGSVRADVPPTPAPAAKPLWVSAYLISGDPDSGRMPLSEIDLSALTDLIDFCLFPKADGSLERTITPAQAQAAIAAGHAAGCKVTVSMGERGDASVRSAISPAHRALLISNLVQFATTYGYDGIDLDDEALTDTDVADYTAFVTDLRAAMDAAKPGMLLSAAVASEPTMFAALQGKFDELNLMTYDNSGLYQDSKSWYNSSLYGSPGQTMLHGRQYPSDDDVVQQYLKAGVAPAKLGLGVAFYGYIWSGIDGPREDISKMTHKNLDDGADYSLIMDKYYSPSAFHWDAVADAPYLSIVAPNPKDSKFISYDDAALCEMKVAYARQQGLGGVMIWELGGGYRKSQPQGQRDALLQSIKQASANPTLDNPAQIPAPTHE